MLPSPLNTEIESLIVVSCEAGGAQILSSLIKNRKFYKKVSFYLQGPAIQIFKAKLGNIDVLSDLSIIESLGKKDFVLVGRSLMCDIEKEATKKANKFHIPNGVFLDHWVNFDSFYMPTAIKNKKDELQYYMPMHVFVGDDYAYDIAEKLYGDIVILESNEYFKDIAKQAAALHINAKADYLLFITDPLSIDNKILNNNIKVFGFDEYDVLRDIFEYMDVAGGRRIQKVVVRPHPNHSEDELRRNIFNKINIPDDIELIVDKGTDLIEQMMSAAVIVGIESVALVIAKMIHRPTYSYVPKYGTKKIIFTDKQIQKVRDLSIIEEFI